MKTLRIPALSFDAKYKFKFLYLFFVLSFLIPSLFIAEVSAGVLSVTASRTSGMAPMAVFFDVVGDMNAPNLNWQEIEEYEYVWNFGDGTPEATGYMAAHVFETQGTFTVTLTQKLNGVPVATDTRTIVVQPFTGQRLALNNGQIYDVSVLNGLTGPVLIEPANSSGPMPTICRQLSNGQCDTSNSDHYFNSGNDWRIVGVRIDHLTFSPGSNTLLYKSWQRPAPIPNGSGAWPGMYVNTNVDGFFIIDSTIEGPVGTTGRYGMIGSGYRVAVVGSEFNNITYTISRCYGSKILWADNRLVKAQGSLNPGFRLLSGKYYYFKGNYILASQAYPIGSARSADQTPTESTEKFLIENNYLTMWTPGGTGFFSDLMVRDLVFRNNVVAGIVDGIRIQNPANGQFPAPPGTVMDGVRIYGNTFFNNFTYFNGVIADGANVVVKNNLISYEGIPAITDPNGDSPRGIISVGDVSHNIVYMRNYPLRCMNAAGQSGSTVCQDPQFASTDPLALNFLHLNSNSPAIDVGTPVIGMYRDYDGTPRPQGAEYDIGAYEYSTGGPVQNHAPIVNAGPDQVISLPSLAQLAGTAVDDNLPAPPQLTVGWSIVSGPGPVVLGNASSLNTTASFSDSGVYVLRLTASDGVLSRSDNVQILVNEESEEPSQSSAPSENKFNACQDLNQSREAKLCFDVAENGFVEVKIYFRDGRLAKKLVSEEKSAGRYTVVWDGKNESGEKVSSGVYRATLTVNGGDIQKIKVIVIN